MITIKDFAKAEYIEQLYFKYKFHQSMMKRYEQAIKEEHESEQDDYIHDMETQGFI